MLCERCGKKTATTHIKTSINGVVETHHFCAECAEKHSQTGAAMFDSLIGSIFGDTLKSYPVTDNRRRCEGCGMCFDDIAKTGKVGCDKCYETFLDQLLPSLQRMHGRSRHAGKVPQKAVKPLSAEERIAELEKQMSKAIEVQDFEQAAGLRDKIKAIKEESGNE